MAVTFNTQWPAALTDKEWQKKKSFLDKAKSKTKTGLGEALTTAQTAWGKIDWKLLKAEGQALPTPNQWDIAKKAAQQHLDSVAKPASKAALDAALKAKTTAANTALSKTAQQAAAALEKGLQDQSRHIRDLKLDDFDTGKQHVIDLTAQVKIDGLKSALLRAHTLINAVEKHQDNQGKATEFSNGVAKASRDITQNSDNIGVTHNKPDPKSLADPLREWNGLSSPPNIAPNEAVAKLNKFKQAVTALDHWAA